LARRVSLPAADDLFRPTTGGASGAEPGAAPSPEASEEPTQAPAAPVDEADAGGSGSGRSGRDSRGRRPSGRVRHDEKMTVYVTADELLDLEHARLLLRRDHGLAVDRGRLVREAVAYALADLEARGEDSVIVQRLKQT
jgi:hypothetical protein